VYPDVASTVDQLVLAADNALLTAKRSGRNKIVTATR
jgi:PleD family two-component response regulator